MSTCVVRHLVVGDISGDHEALSGTGAPGGTRCGLGRAAALEVAAAGTAHRFGTDRVAGVDDLCRPGSWAAALPPALGSHITWPLPGCGSGSLPPVRQLKGCKAACGHSCWPCSPARGSALGVRASRRGDGWGEGGMTTTWGAARNCVEYIRIPTSRGGS
mmetsp:Transcript_47352/g.135105  ORF Transcript_47352/g.135105 Transcript_47352/m.135105 type:complete len:160 (+) Transcript_47352:281-760(+)